MVSIPVTFETKTGILTFLVKEGLSILDAAHKLGLPLTGACEGSLACTTCHVILDRNTYENTKKTLTEREEDLLDSAKELSTTSRLGCQLKISPLLKNARIRIPRINKNIGAEELQKTNEEHKSKE